MNPMKAPLPRPTFVRRCIAFQLPQIEKLDRLAAARYETRSALIRRAIDDLLRKENV